MIVFKNTIFKQRQFLVFIFLLFSILSGQSTGQVEGFDPNSLNDPGPNWPIIINSGINLNDVNTVEQDEESEIQIINGFRVQILATRFANKADSLKSVLIDKIDGQIYVIFEAPNYKVRVGDCIDRKQAELLQEEMRNMGFSAAWIIRERIEWRK